MRPEVYLGPLRVKDAGHQLLLGNLPTQQIVGTLTQGHATHRFLMQLAAVVPSGNVPDMQYTVSTTTRWIGIGQIKVSEPFKYPFDCRRIVTQEIRGF